MINFPTINILSLTLLTWRYLSTDKLCLRQLSITFVQDVNSKPNLQKNLESIQLTNMILSISVTNHYFSINTLNHAEQLPLIIKGGEIEIKKET